MSQKLLIAAGLLALAAPFAAQSQGNPEAARDKDLDSIPQDLMRAEYY